MGGQDHIGPGPVNARIFPVPHVAAALFGGAGWALNHALPATESKAPIPFESSLAGIVIVMLAFAIGGLALREMRRARTTFHPGRSATALVQSGVFSRTRNPMYLSLALVILGLAIGTANPWMAVMAPLFMIYLQERVVRREEAYLGARFGEAYAAYRKRVRRWF